jgi:hypothetical protein
MIAWMIQKAGWFAIRLVVTMACLYTIQQAVHTEGYYIEFKVLLICAVCAIIGMRFWMPSSK